MLGITHIFVGAAAAIQLAYLRAGENPSPVDLGLQSWRRALDHCCPKSTRIIQRSVECGSVIRASLWDAWRQY